MKKERSDRTPKGQSFWQTAPGLITAIAALLTAVGGCVALFTTNPRLLELVLRPSATPLSLTASVPAGAVPAASASTTSATLSPGLSSRPVQLPDGQIATFIDSQGNKYQYTILSATLSPLPPDSMLLDLQIRAYTTYFGGLNFWGDSFRLSVGDQELAPTNFLDLLVHSNETKDGAVQFQVNPSTKEAILNIILSLDMPNNTKQLRLLFP